MTSPHADDLSVFRRYRDVRARRVSRTDIIPRMGSVGVNLSRSPGSPLRQRRGVHDRLPEGSLPVSKTVLIPFS